MLPKVAPYFPAAQAVREAADDAVVLVHIARRRNKAVVIDPESSNEIARLVVGKTSAASSPLPALAAEGQTARVLLGERTDAGRRAPAARRTLSHSSSPELTFGRPL